MTREEIEKAAKYLGELVTPEVRHSEAARVIIQYVNAALTEAVYEIDKHFGIDPDGNHCGINDDDPLHIREKIRALKIGETK